MSNVDANREYWAAAKFKNSIAADAVILDGCEVSNSTLLSASRLKKIC